MGVKVRERDGAWWLFINHQGKRKAKRVGPGEPGEAGRKAAREAAAKIQAKLALGDVGILETDSKQAVPTFEEVAKEWERVAAPEWKQGTAISHGNAIRCRLLLTFGALPITEVTPARGETWWAALRAEGLSPKRLAHLRGLLRKICRRAVRLGYLSANPAEWIEGRLGRPDTERRSAAEYLTGEDLTKLLEAAERVCPSEYPILLVMATCGLMGEAVALQVGDLDTESQQVHVRRAVRRAYITSPKNGKPRVVDAPPSTVAVLARLRELRQTEAAYQGIEARWMFPRPGGTMPLTPEGVRKGFWKALKAAGVRRVRLHDLRHSYATLAVKAGVPLLTVSRQLGHASISTTADLYTHALPGSNRAAAEALEAVLKGNQTQPPRNLTV